jgi:hypothetical protein
MGKERCIVTIEWEKRNNITHAAKRPKRPAETCIDSETRKNARATKKQERETKTHSLITSAMSFAIRKPIEHPHSQFILDRSRKTAKRSLPTPENDQGRRSEIGDVRDTRLIARMRMLLAPFSSLFILTSHWLHVYVAIFPGSFKAPQQEHSFVLHASLTSTY